LGGLWLKLEELAEEAQRARWVRLLRGALEKRGWRRTCSSGRTANFRAVTAPLEADSLVSAT
jgi:hypothetical protein